MIHLAAPRHPHRFWRNRVVGETSWRYHGVSSIHLPSTGTSITRVEWSGEEQQGRHADARILRWPAVTTMTAAEDEGLVTRRVFPVVWLFAIGFVLLAGYYSLATPIFEAPDELWHYHVVSEMARGRFADPGGPAHQEATQPPLYYVLAAALDRLAPAPPVESAIQLNPYFNYRVSGTTNKNLIYHGDAFERFPYQGIARTVHLIRLASIALGTLTVVGVYRLASLVSPGRTRLAALATGFCVLNPEFAFLSGVLTNDAAIIATATWTLVFLGEWINQRRTSTLVSLSLVLGLALLSKATAFGLIPIVAFTLLQHRPSGLSLRSRLPAVAGVVGGALLIAGWWYVRLALLFHDPFGTSVRGSALGRTVPFSPGEAVGDLAELAVTSFARFGWTNVAPPTWIPLAYLAVAVIGLAVATRHPATWHEPVHRVQVLWISTILVLFYLWQIQIPGAQGRLIFPSLGSLALLWATGMERLLSRPRPPLGALAAIGLAGSAGAGALALPLVTIAPAYPPAAARLQATLPVEASPRDDRFDDAVSLVGFQLLQTDVQPGGSLGLQLFWQRGRHASADLSFAAHLLDQRGRQIAGSDRSLAPGLPADQWPEHWIVQTPVEIPVPAEAPVPQVARLEIIVYSVHQGVPQSLAVDNRSATAVSLAAIRLPPPSIPWSGAPVARYVGANGDSIDLLGWSINSADQAPGGTVRGRLLWRASTRPSLDYTIFVHLLSQGRLIAQYDAPPREGAYPTTAWQPGEVIPDSFSITLPENLAARQADLQLGLYDLQTLRRLQVSGGDALHLTTIGLGQWCRLGLSPLGSSSR